MARPRDVPNPTDTHVGRRVRIRRLTLGMTQERLASHLGVTFQQLQKYEKGTNRISASRLQMLSEALGVPVEFFFEGLKRQESSRSFATDFLASPDGVAIAKAFGGIRSRIVRRRIVALIESLAYGNEENE